MDEATNVGKLVLVVAIVHNMGVVWYTTRKNGHHAYIPRATSVALAHGESHHKSSGRIHPSIHPSISTDGTQLDFPSLVPPRNRITFSTILHNSLISFLYPSLTQRIAIMIPSP
mmetsp:Transcript_11191/g.30966  ORF Transcript_11191/g.30966 Transcript_11191/m.30966 type:complete len:114 (+) Transcript_11191:193-534(+)